MPTVWSIYLISTGKRTYIGATTDVMRRLRQHNGEIRGGARCTRGYKWKLVCYVSGFLSRSEAYRWEKIVKHRARGLQNRRLAMQQVAGGVCPRKRRLKQYPVPTDLWMEVIYDS